MRLFVLFAGVSLIALFAAVPMRSAEIKKGPLVVGKNVPGPFHPYNVTARVIPAEELEEADKEEMEKDKDKDKDKEKKLYTTRGKFHCLVTEYDLNPVVLLVARKLNDSEGFRDLLKKLDAAIDKNRLSRLRAFVVFLEEKMNVVTEDEKREQLEKDIQKVADDLGLKNVVLTLAGSKDLAKYDLDDTAALTAILYRTLRIRGSHTFERDDLEKADSAAVKALMTDVSDKLLPKR
jgi:hypothetical protein